MTDPRITQRRMMTISASLTAALVARLRAATEARKARDPRASMSLLVEEALTAYLGRDEP